MPQKYPTTARIRMSALTLLRSPLRVRFGPSSTRPPTRPRHVKVEALRVRHELLELLYTADEDEPGAWPYLDYDSSDPQRQLRVREAERLKKEGLIEGTIGGSGAMQVRIT